MTAVIVLDPSLVVQRILFFTLQREGIKRIYTSRDPAQVYRWLDTEPLLKDEPVLAFVDAALRWPQHPPVNGIEVIRSLKRRRKDLEIVAFVDDDSRLVCFLARLAGARTCEKSFRVETILSLVRFFFPLVPF